MYRETDCQRKIFAEDTLAFTTLTRGLKSKKKWEGEHVLKDRRDQTWNYHLNVILPIFNNVR